MSVNGNLDVLLSSLMLNMGNVEKPMCKIGIINNYVTELL